MSLLTSIINIPSRSVLQPSGRLLVAILVMVWLLLVAHDNAIAKTFPLPPDNQALIGQTEVIEVSAADTLLDVARRYGVGFNEMVAANPDVDPWLPDAGQKVMIPSQYILPEGPREGVVVNLPEMRLYFYPPAKPGEARVVVTYPLGIGLEGRSIPFAHTKITEKKIKPSWVVPESIRAEHAAEGDPLPKIVPPGADNPLGDYAMRLGQSSYLIHGTNRPYSIGKRVSHGCLRMYPEDIAAFFPLIASGTPVRIIDQPYKAGWSDSALYLEAHPPMKESSPDTGKNLTLMVRAIASDTSGMLNSKSWERAEWIALQSKGVPLQVYRQGEVLLASIEQTPIPLVKQREWMVQVGTFQTMGSIRQVSMKMSAIELPMVVSAIGRDGACRVMAGPFSHRKQAESAANKLENLLGLSGIITPESRIDSSVPCQITSK